MAEIIKALVERNRDSIVKRLPTYLSPEKFFQLCYALDRDKQLTAIAQRNPDSVVAAVFKAADCGLTIGGPFGHCWVAPFGEAVELLIGWKGLVYQWMIAGAVIKVKSNVAYLGDYLEVIEGADEDIKHIPKLDDPHRNDPKWMADKKNILGSYSIAWLPIAPLKVQRFCTLGQIEMARAKSKNASGPAWTHSYPSMAAKTAVRRLDGLIQMCGPTDQNREAWDRYAQTLDYDRQKFDPEDEQPDDWPGEEPPARSRPKTGATVEPASTNDTPPPQSEAKSAPPPPSQKPPEPGPEPESQEPITEELQDELNRVATMGGMKASQLKKLVAERFEVLDMPLMTKPQGEKLLAELRKKLGQ